MIIEPFLLSVMAEALRAKIYWKLAFWKGVGQFWSNFRTDR